MGRSTAARAAATAAGRDAAGRAGRATGEVGGPYKNPSYGRNMEKTWAERFPKFEFLARPGLDGDKAYYVYARKRGPGNKRKRA